ncbi:MULTISPECIES: hypothetical protein [Alphaproteobacteria]|uniref:hypothetical protein n=1 Tax=Alphaproteobacteria TaxID=28211 RepID=UPI003299BD00
MAKKFEELHEENLDRAARAFRGANPLVLEKLQGNLEALQQAGRLFQERAEAREALGADLARARSLRIADMVVLVYDEHGAATPPTLDAHFGNAMGIRQNSYREEAARRVDRESAEQLSAFDLETNRLVQELIAKSQTVETAASENDVSGKSDAQLEGVERPDGFTPDRFKASVHAVHEDAEKAENQLQRLFTNDRQTLIDEAVRHGSDNPRSEVALTYRETMERIRALEERDVHALFEQYGWNRTERKELFYRDGRLNLQAFDRAVDGITHDQEAAHSQSTSISFDDER